MSNSVVVCTWERGRAGVPVGAEETLSLACKLAAAAGLELNWLIAGPAPERALEIAGKYGVAHLDRIEDAKLADFQADVWVEALAQYSKQHAPKLILIPQTFNARLVAPRLSARTGAGVVMNALKLEVEGRAVKVTASAYGGDTRVVYELTGAESCVVGVLADMLLVEPPAADSPAPAVRQVAVDLGAATERVRVIQKAHLEGPRLEEAQIIVAGGMGLGKKENYRLIEELAETLGGMAAASRPVVENGWVDSSRQVGLTGKITRPALYIAAGISGASQHMVGCAAAKTIVAINRDPDAAVFRYARYGIVGDCLEILPAITRALKG
ncbi:MAG: electron transfer flavoprotein subunit alpha/FixB family protein [Deltaproteobacteria bacterium]|nr:electron transfer flavoprotein subunit alpha/FixB family protein [Deltaproteobacteria bacterium]